MNAERDLYNLTLCFPVNSPQYCRLRLLLTYFILFCRTFHNIKNRLQIKISSSLNATEQSLPLNRISLLPLLYGLSYIFFHLWMLAFLFPENTAAVHTHYVTKSLCVCWYLLGWLTLEGKNHSHQIQIAGKSLKKHPKNPWMVALRGYN